MIEIKNLNKSFDGKQILICVIARRSFKINNILYIYLGAGIIVGLILKIVLINLPI